MTVPGSISSTNYFHYYILCTSINWHIFWVDIIIQLHWILNHDSGALKCLLRHFTDSLFFHDSPPLNHILNCVPESSLNCLLWTPQLHSLLSWHCLLVPHLLSLTCHQHHCAAEYKESLIFNTIEQAVAQNLHGWFHWIAQCLPLDWMPLKRIGKNSALKQAGRLAKIHNWTT